MLQVINVCVLFWIVLLSFQGLIIKSKIRKEEDVFIRVKLCSRYFFVSVVLFVVGVLEMILSGIIGMGFVWWSFMAFLFALDMFFAKTRLDREKRELEFTMIEFILFFHDLIEKDILMDKKRQEFQKEQEKTDEQNEQPDGLDEPEEKKKD